MKKSVIAIFVLASMIAATPSSAQRYSDGLIDKTIAVVGNEMVSISDIEEEIKMLRARGYTSDRNMRCEMLENILQNKLFLMQARIDSLAVKEDLVTTQLDQRIDDLRARLEGDEGIARYFGKSVFQLRQDWKRQLEEMSLTQQEQQQIAAGIPELTPYDVRVFLDTVDISTLPMVPIKYRMSQIAVYPDREKAAIEVKERLLAIRERILSGDRFSTLARIYSEDRESARRGGELGMMPANQYWPAFADACLTLKPGIISQIVETPDGFHLIEVLERKGAMVNARHILIKPKYTDEDRQKGFHKLDSLRTAIMDGKISFELAAEFYSQDNASRTNGGQMADPYTGSAHFEIDQLKPSDYEAVRNLKEGQISSPVESQDNEGRGNTVYKIIRLDKVVPAHVPGFEKDYSDLLEAVTVTKQNEAIEAFLHEKIKETYIVIDPIFADCSFSKEEWHSKIKKD